MIMMELVMTFSFLILLRVLQCTVNQQVWLYILFQESFFEKKQK